MADVQVTITIPDEHVSRVLSAVNNREGIEMQIKEVGKAIIPSRVAIFYDYNTAAYTSSDADYSAYIKTNYSSNPSIIIYDDIIERNADFLGISSSNAGSWLLEGSNFGFAILNSSYWIDFFTHTGATATGTAKLKIWYYIADFN